MVRPTGKVLYEVGWRGLIGNVLVEIVPVTLSRWKGKKAKRIKKVSGEIREA